MSSRRSLQWSDGAAGPVLAAAEERVPHWSELAACQYTDPEAFFPPKGGSTREAKQVCRGCEVRAECLEDALATGERFGIRGGKSERERRRIQRGRARSARDGIGEAA